MTKQSLAEFQQNKQGKTLCFSGSRDIPFYLQSKISLMIKDILESLYNKGYKTYITGGAVGFDMIAAQTINKFKRTYPDITSVIMMPFPGYNNSWPEHQKDEIEKVMAETDIVIPIGDRYTAWIYHARNDAMVMNSQHLVCFNPQEKKTGGTAYTIRKAKKENLIISNIFIN